jgi:hypothetical protein
MINKSLITRLPLVHWPWLIFEAMDTCVLGESHRSRVDPFADSSLALRVPFLRLTRLRLNYTLLTLLLGALASPPISNPLYNPHRRR